jgi:hypothetical protein
MLAVESLVGANASKKAVAREAAREAMKSARRDRAVIAEDSL